MSEMPSGGFGSFVRNSGAIGAVTSAIGSYFSAQANKTAMQMARDTARFNAGIAQINAKATLSLGNTNAALAKGLGDFNAAMTLGVSDINVSLLRGQADANAAIAAGQYALIVGRGELEDQIHQSNADMLEITAQDRMRQGQGQEQEVMLAAAQLKSTQRARLAANGVQLDSESSVRILTGTDWVEDRDTDTLHMNAVREALGYRMQAGNERLAGAVARLNAQAEGLAYKASAAGAALQSQMDILNTQLGGTLSALNQRQQGDMSALNFSIGSQFQAIDYKLQGLNYTGQAAGYANAASAISPLQAGAVSLINSVSAVAEKWQTYKKAGVY